MQLSARSLFLFAFQWKADSGGLGSVLKAAEKGGWSIAQPFFTQQYSQQNYFHDFARVAVLGTSKNAAVLNFQKKLDQPFYVEISNKPIQRTPENGSTIFQPWANFATLDIYESGVGILTLCIDCPENSIQPADLLAINDLGRRLYPQNINQGGTAAAQKTGLLPIKVGFQPDLEDFSAFDAGIREKSIPRPFLPKYLLTLLGKPFKIQTKEVKTGDILIENCLDDRMYVISCLADELLSSRLSSLHQDGTAKFFDNPFWYKFVFVDGGDISVRNKLMQKALLEKASYQRWLEGGTIFGASRYSFVALSNTGWTFGTMAGNYAQLVKLCLMQRATILRFREEATHISARIAAQDNPSKVADQIRKLQGEFIRFSNRLQFREVTTYEQGIELYDLLRGQMRVQEQIDGLKEELAELHEYATQLHEASRSTAMEWLTVLGAVFLIPSFVLSYFGFFDSWKNIWEQCHLWLVWSVIGGSLLAIGIFFSGLLRRKGKFRIAGILLLLLYFIYVLLLPFLMEWFPNLFGIDPNPYQ